ncbi:protein-glutamate O-methyltransferase CheR, partial [Paraburkholderia sp. BR14262]|uniref:protein-glutamate O-methyltransferase CheR n=1 Tax=Paraburkholderia sp. BR14262 TaxID=3236999 RepID=UPI0034CDD7E2
SAPCSSGEEPYSAAMALLDAGLAHEQFAIDAIDISGQSIAAAARGVYGRNAFRGDGLAFRDRYFEAAPDGWRIAATVRRAVTFERAHLFEWLAPHPVRYDFIFCRNVLNYFDRASQDRAIDLLRARLSAGGMIFVGPAETGLMMRHEMVSAYIPLAFGFRAPEPGATADHQHPASPAAAVPPALTPLPVIAATAAAPAFGSAPVFAPLDAPHRKSHSVPNRTQEAPMPERELEQDRAQDLVPTSQLPEQCWKVIGTLGDNSCPRLETCVRCLNCPVFEEAA